MAKVMVRLDMPPEVFKLLDTMVHVRLTEVAMQLRAYSRRNPVDVSALDMLAADALRNESVELQELSSILTAARAGVAA